MNKQFEKLVGLLKELFQLDQPDLDFGLYRIMHAKAGEVTQFLEKDLLPQVKEAFSLYKTADKAEVERELAKAIEQAQGLGVDPETTQKVKELRAKLANDAVDIGALENEVYDHLYSFFRRYYSEGDFLAKRVYKAGVYAIPYEGEEVKLHWANDEQYYIKTSEYLRDYAFCLRPEDQKNPLRVHFRLVDAAEGEHGNAKDVEDEDRVFILATQNFISQEDGDGAKELIIRFEYRPATLTDWPGAVRDGKTKPPAQKDLLGMAEQRVLAITDASMAAWIVELAKAHITANGELATYSRLHAHLNRYTARNTFDYFIHKDLGGFLRRELDFYIKNEVMHLDDVENETSARVEQYLSKIKVIRHIAGKVIDFLAQLENFQKYLWLKKKFVVETRYCIGLDRVPEDFYPEIVANAAQREEWLKLFAIDTLKDQEGSPGYSVPLTVEFLRSQPSLMIDTRHFSTDFVSRLLATISHLDAATEGLLVYGENFHALSLLRGTFFDRLQCVYIDPPYNTDASSILYKNNYKNSSWVSLLQNRAAISSDFLVKTGVFCMAIDDQQVSEARLLLKALFPEELGVAVVRSNPQSRKSRGALSPTHEYALFYGKSVNAVPGSLELTEKRLARYPLEDDKGRYSWMNFIRTGTNDRRADRPKLFYPIFVGEGNTLRIPDMEWSASRGDYGEYVLNEQPKQGETVIYPVSEDNGARVEKNWHRGHQRVSTEPDEFRVRRDQDGNIRIDFKTRIDEDSTPVTWWDKKEYASANYGAAELKALFGYKPFDFPKAVNLVADCLRASNLGVKGTVIDYFAGSGTTADAVIRLNREDEGGRRFILVEMGAYFDSVLLPRVKKVVYTPEWKDGRPNRMATKQEAEKGPHLIKVLRLESYEDALNNLALQRSDTQKSVLDLLHSQKADGFREEYFLRYMLDVETRGSQSLLNTQGFVDPTAYKLKVKRPGSDESQEVNVDLLETFNWLIGLRVQHIAAPQTFAAAFEPDTEKRLRLKSRLKQDPEGSWWFRTVTGIKPDGRKTLVIWRKLTDNLEEDNLVLDEWFTKQGYSTKDYEFQLIYVNGDNNLENLKAPDDTWKVRPIEEDFHRLMFDREAI